MVRAYQFSLVLASLLVIPGKTRLAYPAGRGCRLCVPIVLARVRAPAVATAQVQLPGSGLIRCGRGLRLTYPTTLPPSPLQEPGATFKPDGPSSPPWLMLGGACGKVRPAPTPLHPPTCQVTALCSQARMLSGMFADPSSYLPPGLRPRPASPPPDPSPSPPPSPPPMSPGQSAPPTAPPPPPSPVVIVDVPGVRARATLAAAHSVQQCSIATPAHRAFCQSPCRL